jgi:alpha-tubulin suppressor-like RCC1 family protein
MSNVSSIILSIQNRMKNSSDPLELMTLSKVIEKLNLRSVTSVAAFSDLPAFETNGNIFLVYSEEELYYNVGNTWYSLGKILLDLVYSAGSFTNNILPSNVQASSPVTILGGITNWSQVSAGQNHSLGIAGGIAYAWGSGSNGRLGTGNNFGVINSPATVVGGITDWTAVTAANTHSLGIAGGIAYAWGDGGLGKIGDGTVISRSSPVTVVGGITGWSHASAGIDFSVGIANGIAYGWGNNNSGQLGDNTVTNKSSPVTVGGGITNWSQISAGSSHSLGIANGIAYAWGSGGTGRLGDDTIINKSSPVTVVGGITDWSQVSGGLGHSLGIAGGIAYAWGNNGSGRLGDGTLVTSSSPVTVVGGITNWSQVSAGGVFSLGLTDSGVIYGWGSNTDGQLGNNTTTASSSPVAVIGGITDWSQVSAGLNQISYMLASSTIKSYIQ